MLITARSFTTTQRFIGIKSLAKEYKNEFNGGTIVKL